MLTPDIYMLLLYTYLYHLTTDVLSPDILLLNIYSCYVITCHLPCYNMTYQPPST